MSIPLGVDVRLGNGFQTGCLNAFSLEPFEEGFLAAYRFSFPAKAQKCPSYYSSDGKNISPELSWQDAPRQTKSFALILDDPDAPVPGGFTH